MESSRRRPTAREAAAALVDAEASRATLADRIVTPPWFFGTLGVAIAVQIAAAAAGISRQVLWLALGGVAIYAIVAGVQLARFRRVNGVWLGGLASRVVLGTGAAASVSYAVAFVAAVWSAYEGPWPLVALWSIVGGAAYALSGRRWLRSYRVDPVAHARGESIAWLALISVAALGGLATLLLNA